MGVDAGEFRRSGLLRHDRARRQAMDKRIPRPPVLDAGSALGVDHHHAILRLLLDEVQMGLDLANPAAPVPEHRATILRCH